MSKIHQKISLGKHDLWICVNIIIYLCFVQREEKSHDKSHDDSKRSRSSEKKKKRLKYSKVRVNIALYVNSL